MPRVGSGRTRTWGFCFWACFWALFCCILHLEPSNFFFLRCISLSLAPLFAHPSIAPSAASVSKTKQVNARCWHQRLTTADNADDIKKPQLSGSSPSPRLHREKRSRPCSDFHEERTLYVRLERLLCSLGKASCFFEISEHLLLVGDFVLGTAVMYGLQGYFERGKTRRKEETKTAASNCQQIPETAS